MSSSDVGPTTTSEKRALSVEKEVVFSSKYTIRKICFKSDKFIPSGKSSVFTRNLNPGLKPGFLWVLKQNNLQHCRICRSVFEHVYECCNT